MSWKVIWKSLKTKDMRNRILAVLGMLLVFRIMAHIPIPLADPTTLKQVLENVFTSTKQASLLSFIDVLSGGALANFAIMLVGLGPYINASIIIQLLTKAIPQLENLNNEGEFGRKKINQYTRMLTFPLAIIQSVGALYLVNQTARQFGSSVDITTGASLMQWVLMVAALTGGAMILMWLGELITEQNVGNGISLIITVGIVSRLPATISSVISSIIDKSSKWVLFGKTLPINKQALLYGLLILAIIIVVTIFIVKLNEASRNLTINYAKRVQGNRTYGGVSTVLPVKLITAGVIPIIFAVAFLSVPSFAGQILSSNHSARLAHAGTTMSRVFQTPSSTYFAEIKEPATTKVLNYGMHDVAGVKTPEWSLEPLIYPATYFLLVFVFTYFYTSITFNAKEIAENLQKQGGFIADVRSGLQTEKYLSRVVNRLTFFGALALGFLALLPIVGQIFLKTNIAIGGTSILILVSVALETLRAIESRALMVTYDQYEQPDFFYDNEPPATGARKLRFLPKRRVKKTTKA